MYLAHNTTVNLEPFALDGGARSQRSGQFFRRAVCLENQISAAASTYAGGQEFLQENDSDYTLVVMVGSNKAEKAVVLLSGGMDSCVTATIAHQTHRLALVHASYGQRTERRERRAFEEIAHFYGVRERLVVRLDHFRQIGGSALTDPNIAVPESKAGMVPQPSGGIPITYVPFRNAHFLSVAVSWAEVIGARAIFIGAVAEDSSGYPDCRPEYYRVFSELVRVGTRPETRIEIVTPVIGMRKHEIVRRGVELGAPLHLTWSCYQFEDEACGCCDSCLLRLRAFEQAGQCDPIPYRTRVAP